QRPALGLSDAAGAHPLRRPHLGAADPDRLGPLAALRQRPWSPAQDDHRLGAPAPADRKSTRLNSSHLVISYAVFCLKKKKPKIRFCFWSTKKGLVTINGSQ